MKTATKGRFTFPGGVHPPQSKELTAESKIQPGPAAKQVAVMLSQHIGAPCEPLVKKADPVQAGQKIGDSDAFVSAPVHSPVNGKVKEVALQPHVVLGRSLAVIIEADPEGNQPKQPCCAFNNGFDISKYSAEQICDAVRQA
jgi:electron transport complex protein RnfC